MGHKSPYRDTIAWGIPAQDPPQDTYAMGTQAFHIYGGSIYLITEIFQNLLLGLIILRLKIFFICYRITNILLVFGVVVCFCLGTIQLKLYIHVYIKFKNWPPIDPN